MRRWGKQLRKDAPRYHRPSLRGTAADEYERPCWMMRVEPYETPDEEMYVIHVGRRVYPE